MKRLRIALRITALGIAVALPVSADAPISGPYPQYGPFVGTQKTITDIQTHLVWERPAAGPGNVYPAVLNYTDAQSHCANLTLIGSAGSMRLPTMKELLTLVDEDPHDEYDGTKLVPHFIDRNAFHNTPADDFWTSSAYSASEAYTINFGTGATGRAKMTGDARYVRCVGLAP